MNRTQIILLSLLLVLIGIWAVTSFLDDNREKTFAPEFPQLILNEIHTLKIYPEKEGGEEVILYYSGDEWRVMKGMVDMPVHDGRMDVLFNELSNLKPTRLAGTTTEEWAQLGVTDTTGTRLVLLSDQGPVLDMIIGQFQYRDADIPSVNRAPPGTQGKRGITYVRISEDERVYAAEGFFGPNFNQEFGVWRNQQLLEINPEELEQMTFTYADEEPFTILVEPEGWYYRNQQLSEEAVEKYALWITKRTYTYFADGFEVDRNPMFKVVYELSGNREVTIEAFEANSGQVIIRSSQNPETFFLDFDDMLIDQLFPPLYFFTGEKEWL